MSHARQLSSNKIQSILFEPEAGEAPGRIGACVDVDAIWPNLWLHDGRMSVDDDLTKIILVQEEVFPNPEHVPEPLLRQRDAGSHSGVDEKIVPAVEGRLQLL